MNWPEEINGVRVPHELPLDVLSELAGSSSPARWAALHALGRKATPEATEKLIQFSKAPDPHVRRMALEVMALMPGSTPHEGAILAGLQDSSLLVVRTACEIVGRLGGDLARPVLRRLATDSDTQTRVVAVRALAELGDEGDFEVAEALLDDPDPAIRKEGGFACRKLVSAKSWRRLSTRWVADALPRHRVWGVELVRDFGTAADRPVLEALHSDPDGHVRGAVERALEALGERGD